MTAHTGAQRRRDDIIDRVATLETSVGGAITTEDVQDVVGAMLTDSSSIDFTYNDGAGTETAVIKAGSVTAAMLDTAYDVSGAASAAVSAHVAAGDPHTQYALESALGTLSTQNGTFSGTHSGTSSGTNTGDQTNITGNAGTVTSIAGATGLDAWHGTVFTTASLALTNAYADFTPASGPSLSFPVVAGGTYKFSFHIWTIADAVTTGIDCAINGPTIGAGTMSYQQRTFSSATAQADNKATAYDTDTAQQNSQGNVNRIYIVAGRITLGATSGNVIARVKRENVGSGTAQVDSWVDWQRLS